MRTGDWRGAGPFAAEWILTAGRQFAPDERPQLRIVSHADAPDMTALAEPDSPGAWIRAESLHTVLP